MLMKYAISVKLVSMSLPLFFTPNSPNKRANSPDKRASSPDKRASSPDKRASSPDKSASSPDRSLSSPDMTLGSPHLAQSSPPLSSSSPQLSPNSLHWPLNSPHLKALPTAVLAQPCMEQMPAQLVSEKMGRLLDSLSRVCRTSLISFLPVQPREVCHA